MSNLADRLFEQAYVRDEISDTLDALEEKRTRKDAESIMMEFAERVIEIWDNRIDGATNADCN